MYVLIDLFHITMYSIHFELITMNNLTIVNYSNIKNNKK